MPFNLIYPRPSASKVMAYTAFWLAIVAVVPSYAADGDETSHVFRSDIATLTMEAEKPAPHGLIRGSLTIELAPGWKTYWLDPGPSGIPPKIDFSGTQGLGETAIFAPLPERFGEELARANGYKHDVALPFVLTPSAGETIAGPLEADVFIGVCKDICVPVQATLSAEPAAGGTSQFAFDALPAALPAGAANATIKGDALVVSVDGSADLKDAFVLGSKGWYFGEPDRPDHSGDQTTFRVPIDERPREGLPGPLTVVFDDGAKGLVATVQVD